MPGKRLRGPNGSVVLTNVDVGEGDVTAGALGDGFGVERVAGATGVVDRVAVAGMVVDVPGGVGVLVAPGVTVTVAVDVMVGVGVAVGTAVEVDVWLGGGVCVDVAVSTGVGESVPVAVGVFVAVGTPVDVAVGTPVEVAVGTPVEVALGTPVEVALGGAVEVALGAAVAVSVTPVGVDVDVPPGVVGVLVAVGTLVGVSLGADVDVSVAAGEVAVDVGVAAAQGGKLGDFSGFRSGRNSVSVSMRREFARGSTAATEMGPNGTTISSPGATVTSSVNPPPGTGTNSAVPPREGGMCCISRNGRLSLIVEDVGFEIVTVPDTPPGPQEASMATIVRLFADTRATPAADALATIATPSASAMNPATKCPLRGGMSTCVSMARTQRRGDGCVTYSPVAGCRTQYQIRDD